MKLSLRSRQTGSFVHLEGGQPPEARKEPHKRESRETAGLIRRSLHFSHSGATHGVGRSRWPSVMGILSDRQGYRMGRLANRASMAARKVPSRTARFSLPRMDPCRLQPRQVQGQFPQQRQTPGAMSLPVTGLVLVEHHVQAPVQFGLDAPMVAYNLIELSGEKALRSSGSGFRY